MAHRIVHYSFYSFFFMITCDQMENCAKHENKMTVNDQNDNLWTKIKVVSIQKRIFSFVNLSKICQIFQDTKKCFSLTNQSNQITVRHHLLYQFTCLFRMLTVFFGWHPSSYHVSSWWGSFLQFLDRTIELYIVKILRLIDIIIIISL